MRENGRCGKKKLLKNFTKLRLKVSLNCGFLEAIFFNNLQSKSRLLNSWLDNHEVLGKIHIHETSLYGNLRMPDERGRYRPHGAFTVPVRIPAYPTCGGCRSGTRKYLLYKGKGRTKGVFPLWELQAPETIQPGSHSGSCRLSGSTGTSASNEADSFSRFHCRTRRRRIHPTHCPPGKPRGRTGPVDGV